MTTYLLDLVKSGNHFQKEVAERIFSELEDRLGEEMLVLGPELLSDGRPGVRQATLEIFVEYCGFLENETINEALALLADGDPLVRGAAIRLAQASSPECAFLPAIIDLIHCLEDTHAENRDAAIETLDEMAGSLKSDSYLRLAEYLSHDDRGMRYTARQMLFKHGQEDLIRGHNET